MKLISIQCGLPRQVEWHGNPVTTSIFKDLVIGRVAIRTLNLDGDRQSDLSVHGGRHKAVYCYPDQHYSYWKSELPGHPLPAGAFGENFTIEDSPLEDSIYIGDTFSVGTAEVVVTQPRLPCYKLGIKFGSDAMIKRFLDSGRTGYYLAVMREGEVGAGDEFIPLTHDPESISIAEITRLYIAKGYDSEDVQTVRRALAVEALPESWKDYLREKLKRSSA